MALALELLVKTCWSALVEADRLGLGPTALHRQQRRDLPVSEDRCAELPRWTLENWCRSKTHSSLRDLRIVLNTPKAVEISRDQFQPDPQSCGRSWVTGR